MQLTIINGTLAASFVLLAVGSTACTRDQEVSTEMQARMSVEELALEEVCVDLRSQFAFRAQRLLESTPEPVIKGRPLSQWVAALGDAEPMKRLNALRQLGMAGAAAKPAAPRVYDLLWDPEIAVLPDGQCVDQHHLGRVALRTLVSIAGDEPEVALAASCCLGRSQSSQVATRRSAAGHLSVVFVDETHREIICATLADASSDQDHYVREAVKAAYLRLGCAQG